MEARVFYDRYWQTRARARLEARSRERAGVALELLGRSALPRGRLLDLGCGPGYALEVFQRAGYSAVGIDASAVAVAEARNRGLEAHCLDLEAQSPGEVLRAAGGKFAAITLLEVLEHLVDPLALLHGLRPWLEPPGRVVASLPNEISLPARLPLLLGRMPFGGHADPHLRHFDRRQARRLFEEAGYRVEAEHALGLAPPRWPILRALLEPGVRLFPGALALATVYLLAAGDEHGSA